MPSAEVIADRTTALVSLVIFSEIEVSKLDEWNPTTIEERGLQLLSFMEKRWDIKFKNEDTKKKLLFLDVSKEDAQNKQQESI